MPFTWADKIYVAGHRGMVGAALVRELQQKGYEHIVTRTSAELHIDRRKKGWRPPNL